MLARLRQSATPWVIIERTVVDEFLPMIPYVMITYLTIAEFLTMVTYLTIAEFLTMVTYLSVAEFLATAVSLTVGQLLTTPVLVTGPI